MHASQSRGLMPLCLTTLLLPILWVGGSFLLEAKHPPSVQEAFITLRIPLTLMAGALLAAGAFVSLRGTPGSRVASLLLMEGCALLGVVLFFLGLPALELVPFCAVSVAGQALLVLPKVLRRR